MKRRDILRGLSLMPLLAPPFGGALAAAAFGSMKDVDALRRSWKDLLAPNAGVTTSTQPLQRSEAQWREVLTKAQFNVLRKAGTEPAGSSPLNGEKRPGVFVCAGCSLPLFTSAMKYDSGTGWPSFFTTIPGMVATKDDYFLIVHRTEYHCIRCGGHQGHVFGDGPPPTGQRWCNNGLALRFIPKTGGA